MRVRVLAYAARLLHRTEAVSRFPRQRFGEVGDGDPGPPFQVVGGFMGSYYPGTGTGVLATVSMGRTAGKAVLA